MHLKRRRGFFIDPLILFYASPGSEELEEVQVDRRIQMYFVQEIDVATVNAETMLITEDGIPIPGTFVTFVAAGEGWKSYVEFTPTNPMSYNKEIVVALTTSLKSTTGQPLADRIILSFLTTGEIIDNPVTSPEGGSEYVDADSTITFTFNRSINPATVTTSSVRVHYIE